MNGADDRAEDSEPSACPDRQPSHALADGTFDPAIISNSVVLPAPFGPMTPTISGCMKAAIHMQLKRGLPVKQAAAIDLVHALQRK